MRKFLLCLPILLIAFTLISNECVSVQANSFQGIIISEVMPDPAGDDAFYEWIEIQNTANISVNLNTLKLNGLFLPNTQISPSEIIVLAKNSSYLLARYPDTTNKVITYNLSLPNSGGALTLTDNTDKIIQVFTYSQAQPDKSFELLQGDCGLILMNSTNTIGRTNTLCTQATPIPVVTSAPILASVTPFSNYSNLIVISKINACTSDEYLTLRNYDSYSINLNGWIVEDKSGNQDIISGQSVSVGNEINIYPQKVTLNNSGDVITLNDPSGMQKDIFVYTECSNSVSEFSIRQEKLVQNSDANILVKSTTPTTVKSTQKVLILQYPRLYLMEED
jgi:hypothetical protein